MKFIYVASVVNTLNVSEYTTQNNLTWKNLIVMGSQLSLLKELWDVLPDENGNQTKLNTQQNLVLTGHVTSLHIKLHKMSQRKNSYISN